MKKLISLLLVAVLVISTLTVAVITGCAADAVEPIGEANIAIADTADLYAHAYSDPTESQAWVKWYEADSKMYFFMPTATNANTIEIYNAYSTDAKFNTTTIPSGQSANVSYTENKEYTVTVGSKTYKAVIMRSSAEGAVFINNISDFDGKKLWDYLTDDKENEASATGAMLDDEGNINNESIKKIKGRGNTSWDADKKGFNVTYDNAVSLDGMQDCKKFSLISNFQDASLARNRILYDLADEIGVPYASDSRFIEFYVNGEYIGNYQMCEKVDVGKNTLMPDIDEDDYLNYCNGSATNFEFVCEIDSNPSDDDFTVRATNGNNLTMKTPELEKGDSNYQKAQRFIKAKYDVMYNKVTQNAADVNDYIDIESLAQVYLINELGKNWDAGAGSFFFVYKPDENGKYKFYASPVWDYDNSLGNAQGVEGDLNNLGIRDYEEPTGWFAKHKNGYRGPNFLKESISNCDALNEMIPTVWFEQFVPAIENRLNGKSLSDTELYSADVYKSYLTKSADMNFIRWDIIQEPQWIADHTTLKKCSATYTYNNYGQVTGVSYKQDNNATVYDEYVFDAEYQYMLDWTNSRVAWMSNQYFKDYTPSEIIPTEPPKPTETEPVVTPDPEPELNLSGAIAAWQFDPTGKVEEEKLTEYGSGDEGYKATYGNGKLIGTVDGSNMRSLEWSSAEYGNSGVNMVPIMAAGSKNLWSTPFVQFEISTKNYTDIHFTAYMAGSKKCPASWQMQYSVDGENFVDVENAVATIDSSKRKLMTPYFENLALPKTIENKDSVIIRLVPTSKTTVSGGSIDDDPTGGELALNNILISGKKASTGVKGDADLDGEVSIMDATAIQFHLAQFMTMSDEAIALSDADDDGELTIMDATQIQFFLAQMIDEL